MVGRHGTHVYVIREVVPRAGGEGHAIFRHAADVPLKVGRVRADTVLKLSEVRLEK